MSTKIDELFAPARLRKNWQKIKERPEEQVENEKENKFPLDIFLHMQALTQESFSGDDVIVLNLLLDELHVLLIAVFPENGESPAPAEERAKIIPAIYEVLNRIEDIWEAFEAAGRNRNRR
jgi:hypothetical protein